MADLSITVASVLAAANAPKSSDQTYVWGEAVTRGMSVYRNADGKFYRAKATTAILAAAVGIALVDGATGQPAIYQTGGSIAIGATGVAGTIYVVSAANFGGIAPWADIATGNFVTILGVGDGAGNIALSLNPTGIAHA